MSTEMLLWMSGLVSIVWLIFAAIIVIEGRKDNYCALLPVIIMCWVYLTGAPIIFLELIFA